MVFHTGALPVMAERSASLVKMFFIPSSCRVLLRSIFCSTLNLNTGLKNQNRIILRVRYRLISRQTTSHIVHFLIYCHGGISKLSSHCMHEYSVSLLFKKEKVVVEDFRVHKCVLVIKYNFYMHTGTSQILNTWCLPHIFAVQVHVSLIAWNSNFILNVCSITLDKKKSVLKTAILHQHQ